MSCLIADGLSKVKNAILTGREEVKIRKSNFIHKVFEVMCQEGFFNGVSIVDGDIVISLKYDNFGIPVIRKLSMVSKPSRRIYLGKSELSKLRKKRFSLLVLSTSEGVMSDVEAYNRGIGGEIVCEVY
ncbi:MAG: 30S ribosomal protein S8 [Alphaproteobacteria bacterium]|nr:MAG: 30S ribosomal protein S8 [Alphaproteobacteria bacterium]